MKLTPVEFVNDTLNSHLVKKHPILKKEMVPNKTDAKVLKFDELSGTFSSKADFIQDVYSQNVSESISNILKADSDMMPYNMQEIQTDFKDIMLIKDITSTILDGSSTKDILNNIQLVMLLLKKQGLLPQFGGILGDIMNMIAILGPNLSNGLNEMWGWLKEGAKDVFDWFATPFLKAGEIASDAWSGIKTGFAKVVEWITGIGDTLSDAKGWAEDKAEDAWDTIKGGAEDAYDAVSDFASSLNPF